MPGRGSYGLGGKWIYQRAARLREKNPEMEESTSFAIATQQAHKVNKSPKGFRTAEGVREAKAKMTGPIKEYRKTAAVRHDGTLMKGAAIRLDSFFDEMDKSAGLKMKALKFLAGYLIAKKIFGLGQSKEQKMSEGELRAMQMGMQMGAQSAGARGVTREMGSDIAPFEGQMSRIESDLRKTAALGVDLRLNGPGGIKRPQFPTEDSKGLALKQFKQSRKIGQSTAVRPPEPNIRSVTSLPG